MRKILLGMTVCLSFLLISGAASAYTAIAVIKGRIDQTWSRVSNASTQHEADSTALSDCRAAAQKNGLAKIAKQCMVVTRARGPGYGAVTCGAGGCNWSTGYPTAQAAVDAAYQGCSRSYKNCKQTNISSWQDFAGFPQAQAQTTVRGFNNPGDAQRLGEQLTSPTPGTMTFVNGHFQTATGNEQSSWYRVNQ